MDADERLMALKKAYADIILNTEKEAAQRIMVSERKAVRLEYELKVAKEDAVQMLMRVKQMMDCKISEAAVASCTREKKIEELEAQLQEAEDIVKDLREELRTVESEVERFSKIKDVKHTVQVANAPTHEPVTYRPLEVQPNSYIDQTNKNQRFFSSLFPLKKSLIDNGDLPSIISRSKETELFRNGCTQRIRACERTTPDINKNINAKLMSAEDEVPEKELVLEEVKEIDLSADNSYLTSPDSVKNTNDIPVDENMVRMCNRQSTSGEEVMPVRQEKDEVDPPLMSTESKVCATDEVPSQPLRNRVIKYTFQRKRKRGTLIDGSGSSERSHENQMAHVGSVKGNLIGESTPEKIRLEQVAHQLISLLDNKCR
ncbi:hypothetical protein HanRHA438_Chr16g0742681 [Helianthus annuus]|nr:hypothetical protein HanHA300_Chr16g0595351 [Helianthus annuus]KAJ0441120.1 hypothetical protein HanIR_Chr16g0794151 [Helianthus annuus]KAJ0643663.1 hypothetical protein HanOQP8_Chr16g0603051 [Helianthus annuus]KAJ0819795.1 hypothetical protein HanPSC8_Chr16g0700191 [Helianthus annuus]KAJ0834350.1 hypothetical protein HanRHA438_Chr16g0742681 [Helianthus annuus]